MSTADRYAYEAVDASGRLMTGEVEAESVDDAIKTLRGQGLYPTALQNASRTSPPQDRGLQCVQLVLLQALHDGATEIVFDLSEPDAASIQRRIAGSWSAWPLPPARRAEDVRRALCSLSAEPELGRVALDAEREVDLTSALPSFQPLRARLRFHSSADAPEKIHIVLPAEA